MAAGWVLLLGVVTSDARAADIDWAEQLASALKATPELSIEGLEPGDAGKDRLAKLDETCVQPSVRSLSEAVDGTSEAMRREPLQALESLLPYAAAADQRLNRCLVQQGVDGSAAYLLDGRRLSAYAYVQTLKRIVSDQLASAKPSNTKGGARR